MPPGSSKRGEDEGPKDGLTVDDSEQLRICCCGRQFGTVRGMKIHRTKMGCVAVEENCDAGRPPACESEGDQPPVENHSGQGAKTLTSVAHHNEVTLERIAWPAMSADSDWKKLDETA